MVLSSKVHKIVSNHLACFFRQANATFLRLIADTSVQGKVISTSPVHNERRALRSERATQGVRKMLSNIDDSDLAASTPLGAPPVGKRELSDGLEQVMNIMATHPYQVVRDYPEMLPTIAQNSAEVSCSFCCVFLFCFSVFFL